MVLDSEQLISTNVTKAKKFAEKKISQSYLTSCNWIRQNSNNETYTFRSNGELLVSKNGIVERKKYELIIDNNSIIISNNSISEMYNIVLVKDDFLHLHRISTNEILVFMNQTKIKDEVKYQAEKNYNQFISAHTESDKVRSDFEAIQNDPDIESLCYSFQKSWEEDNPSKTIYDYVAFLENKHFYSDYLFSQWKENIPEGTLTEYVDFLIYKKYIKK
ncbi:hypothetical protein SAMN02927903_03405 [Flavobacterium caeni]|uniref:Uncharacterized protein n=2 Tax=Flavobacterium caeni TaxID=490189 RepID=A0A1G5KP39_9FLAO|nr:hypothetical protein SAMN02927903_03405 [Flavobacterium caeni]